MFQSLWIFSLINYEPPTYNNGEYNYPTWAHALGWSFTAASLVCIPIYGVIAIIRSEGDTFLQVNIIKCNNNEQKIHFCINLQKLRNSIRPDIYECKICGEHHCEHDTPDFHSVQEMQTIYQQMPITTANTVILQQPPVGRATQPQQIPTTNGGNVN